jgi:hypothetical protein
MGAIKLVKDNAVPAILLFTLVAIAASAISISALKGVTGSSFTAFEFIGVLPAAFLGPVLGIFAILLAKLTSAFFLSTTIDSVFMLRLLPPVLAAYYFATYKNAGNSRVIQVIVPLACMALFIANPVGSQAWQYSLYWLIPPIIALAKPSHLFLRSLGTTFTQHAIGGVIWLYFVAPMAPAAWLALIPIVAGERLLFASGISLSYVALNAIVSRVKWLANSTHVNIAPLPFSVRRKK